MSKPGPARSVDDYLAALAPEVQATLQNLRETIKAAAPEAEEVISYQIPTYKYHGSLVHFMAARHHCSLIAVSKSVLETLQSDLAGYKVSGTTIRFTVEKPLPATLVTRIVQARMQENEARTKKGK